MLTDAELCAVIAESGWVLRDKNALDEFRKLARAIEKRVRLAPSDGLYLDASLRGVFNTALNDTERNRSNAA